MLRREIPRRRWAAAAGLLGLLIGAAAPAKDADPAALKDEARLALRRAGKFFLEEVAAGGGYLWRYSEDLRLREGEGKAGPDTIWVQPPGTPSVGMAFLEAHRATGDEAHLRAARAAAEALIRGQLRSGGWTYRIELAPAERAGHAYRTEPEGKKRRNWSTLDDETTQAALRFLMRIDRALGFQDKAVHEAVLFGLEALLAAQLPNGGFPQGFQGPADAARAFPERASIPAEWPRTHPRDHDYWVFPTLNDGVLDDVVEVLLEAEETYRDSRFRRAAERVGDFLIAAQLPEPQPAWAQQYGFDMTPVWARKFEPPSITGGESQGAMETLLRLHRATGRERCLEPIPRALAYLRRSLLPDGRLARFYELGTNRPLYFDRKYELTHRDDDLPTHYSFQVASRLDRIEEDYRRAAKGPPAAKEASRPRSTSPEEARRIIAALDQRGRWVEEGTLKAHQHRGKVIEARTFVRNVEALSRFIAPAR